MTTRPTEWSATMDTKSRPLADSIDLSCWTIQIASFIVVDDRRANIQGRNLLRKSEYNYTRREKQLVSQHFMLTILTAQIHKSRRGYTSRALKKPHGANKISN